MKNVSVIIAIFIALGLSACASTSISEAGYAQPGKPGYSSSLGYDRELNEFSVLGVNKLDNISTKHITDQLKNISKIRITTEDSVLLIQSGAAMPDAAMVSALSQYWDINTLTGENQTYNSEGNINTFLRYVAASGGNRYVLVYWGVVETADRKHETKGISWVPIVGWTIPDETTQMRIRLKFAIIDVDSGRWNMFQPTPVEDEFLTSIMNRSGKSQSMAIELKKHVYNKAAKEIHGRFSM